MPPRSVLALGLLGLIPPNFAVAASVAETFRRLDRDGDGKLTRAEAGPAPFFDPADADRDGTLTLAELERHARSRPPANAGRGAGMEGDGAGPADSRVRPAAVSETDSPLLSLDTTAADGRTVRAYWRRPAGAGAWPAIVFIHGGLSRQEDAILMRQLRVNPVTTRLLERGYIVAHATFRTYEQDIQSRGPIEDVRAVVQALARETTVDPRRIALFGGSGGGSIALELGADPAVRAVVAGEPATLIYTGMLTTGEYGPRLAMMADPARYLTPELRAATRAKLRGLRAPVLILHSDQHDLRKLNAPLFLPLMREEGVAVEYREYPGYGHGFYFGGGDDRWGKGADEPVVAAVVRDVADFLARAMPAATDEGAPGGRPGKP